MYDNIKEGRILRESKIQKDLCVMTSLLQMRLLKRDVKCDVKCDVCNQSPEILGIIFCGKHDESGLSMKEQGNFKLNVNSKTLL